MMTPEIKYDNWMFHICFNSRHIFFSIEVQNKNLQKNESFIFVQLQFSKIENI